MNHPQDLLELSSRDKIDIFIRKVWAWNILSRLMFRYSVNTRMEHNRRLQFSKMPRKYEKQLYAKILKHGEFKWSESNPKPTDREYRFQIGEIEFTAIVKDGIDCIITDAKFRIEKENKEVYKKLFNGNAQGEVRPLFRWWFESYVQNRFNDEFRELFNPNLNKDTLEEIVFERDTKNL